MLGSDEHAVTKFELLLSFSPTDMEGGAYRGVTMDRQPSVFLMLRLTKLRCVPQDPSEQAVEGVSFRQELG